MTVLQRMRFQMQNQPPKSTKQTRAGNPSGITSLRYTTSGLTGNSRPPWTRSVTDPTRSCLPLWSNSRKRIAADNQAIKARQQLLQNLHPNKHSFQASRIQATNRARPRPRPRTEKTHNTQQTCNFASVQAQLPELQKMFCQLSESVNVNKNRVEPYTGVSSSDSKLTNPKRYAETSHKKCSHRRNSLNKRLTHHTRAKNKRYIKNLSSQALTNDEVRLLYRGLNFKPTPPVPSSNKPLLFDHFARTMRLKYMFAKKQKTSVHPFHVKSTWQPPVQNLVALENYLEETKLEIASAILCPQFDKISANKRKFNAISALKCNSKINLKKANKRTIRSSSILHKKLTKAYNNYLMTSFTSLSHLLLCIMPSEKRKNWSINYTVRDTSTYRNDPQMVNNRS